MSQGAALRFLALGTVMPFASAACSVRAEHSTVPAETPDAAAVSVVPASSVAPAVVASARAVSPPGAMILLKGGRFKMGSDGVGYGTEDEGPSRFLTLPSFRMDVTEVTVSAYRACVQAGDCETPAMNKSSNPTSCNWNFDHTDDDPVECVTWHQAVAYCKWSGKELPTEDLWEYASRGKDGRDFPWGRSVRGHDWGAPDDLNERVNGRCRGQRRAAGLENHTCPVGGAPKGDTPEGIHDLGGGVGEWTASPFCKYDKPGCGSPLRSVRGGPSHLAEELRGVHRFGFVPEMAFQDVGFRCAQRLEDAKSP